MVIGTQVLGGAWTRLQSAFSRRRYGSVSHHRQEAEFADFKDKKALSSSGILDSGASRGSNDNAPGDDLNQRDERSANGGIATEDGTSLRPPRRDWVEGVYLCAKGSAVVLLLHLVFVAFAAGLASRHPGQGGFASGEVMYDGSCTVTKRWSTGLHLIINILSSRILGASNYCMQTLVAPTREDIERAHVRRRWLDIGCASMRNLFAIGRSRLGLWVVLLVTATPIHLL